MLHRNRRLSPLLVVTLTFSQPTSFKDKSKKRKSWNNQWSASGPDSHRFNPTRRLFRTVFKLSLSETIHWQRKSNLTIFLNNPPFHLKEIAHFSAARTWIVWWTRASQAATSATPHRWRAWALKLEACQLSKNCLVKKKNSENDFSRKRIATSKTTWPGIKQTACLLTIEHKWDKITNSRTKLWCSNSPG